MLRQPPFCERPWRSTRPTEGRHSIIFSPNSAPSATTATTIVLSCQSSLESAKLVGYSWFYGVRKAENFFWRIQHGVSRNLKFFFQSEDEEWFLGQYSTFCLIFCIIISLVMYSKRQNISMVDWWLLEVFEWRLQTSGRRHCHCTKWSVARPWCHGKCVLRAYN